MKQKKKYLPEPEKGDRRWNGVGRIEVMTMTAIDEDNASNERGNRRVRERGVFRSEERENDDDNWQVDTRENIKGFEGGRPTERI